MLKLTNRLINVKYIKFIECDDKKAKIVISNFFNINGDSYYETNKNTLDYDIIKKYIDKY